MPFTAGYIGEQDKEAKENGFTPPTSPSGTPPSDNMNRTKSAITAAGTSTTTSKTQRYEYDAMKSDRTREATTRASGGYDTTRALNEYEAAKRRATLFRGSGSSAYELDKAKTKLSDMGITDDERGMWDRSSIKDRSAISGMLDSKREALRSTPGLDPNKLKFDEEKRVWYQEGFTPQAQAAKAPSQFQSFVSDLHRDQLAGTQGQARPIKVSLNVPTGDPDYDTNTKPFTIIQDTIKSGMKNGSVTRRQDGSYYFSRDALKELAASGGLSDTESRSLMKSQYGATMSVGRSGSGDHVASFSAAGQGLDERTLEARAQSFIDSAFGKYLQNANQQIAKLEGTIDQVNDFGGSSKMTLGAQSYSDDARNTLNSILNTSGLAFDEDGQMRAIENEDGSPSETNSRGVLGTPGNANDVIQSVNNAYRVGSGQSQIDYSKPAQSKDELEAIGKAKRESRERRDRFADWTGISV